MLPDAKASQADVVAAVADARAALEGEWGGDPAGETRPAIRRGRRDTRATIRDCRHREIADTAILASIMRHVFIPLVRQFQGLCRRGVENVPAGIASRWRQLADGASPAAFIITKGVIGGVISPWNAAC